MTVYDKERAQINVELDVDVRDEIKRAAKANDRSFSAEVRQALRYWAFGPEREGKK